MPRVEWTETARKDGRRLGREAQRRIAEAVNRFAETGLGDVTRLQGEHELRLRVGQWRVRFSIDYAEDAIRIIRVLPRGRAYRA